MKICFIDEAGDLGALANPPLPNDQPVLVISGLFVDAASLHGLTDDFLNLKQRYFPNLPYPSAIFRVFRTDHPVHGPVIPSVIDIDIFGFAVLPPALSLVYPPGRLAGPIRGPAGAPRKRPETARPRR